MMNTTKTQLPDMALENMISGKPMDLFIRAGLVGFLVVYCYGIFKPFIALMLWSVILAVALYPLHALIARKMGGKQGHAATVLVLAILLGVLVPTTLLAISFADSTIEFVKQVQNGTLQVPAPRDSVATWPLVGGKLHALWSAAHNDIGSVLTKFEPKIAIVTKQILGYAASAGTATLKFLISLVVAGIWMAYALVGPCGGKSHCPADSRTRERGWLGQAFNGNHPCRGARGDRHCVHTGPVIGGRVYPGRDSRRRCFGIIGFVVRHRANPCDPDIVADHHICFLDQ